MALFARPCNQKTIINAGLTGLIVGLVIYVALTATAAGHLSAGQATHVRGAFGLFELDRTAVAGGSAVSLTLLPATWGFVALVAAGVVTWLVFALRRAV